MIVAGNTKLGRSVWTWSIPAATTCPGASEACLSVCYARRGFMVMPSVSRAHHRNWELSKQDDFADLMVAEIIKRRAKLLRIHVAGDFYSAEYLVKWLDIIRRCPATLFYAYTRSWTQPTIAPDIQTLAREANVKLWLSFDHSMPVPPVWPETKRCYMSLTDLDNPPAEADLVFRNYDKTIKKSMNGVITCPPENGVTETTCEKCRICWRDKATPTPKVHELELVTLS